MQKERNDIKDQRGNKKTKGERGKKSRGFPARSAWIRSVDEGSEVKLKWLNQGDLCATLLIFIRIWMSVGLLFIILLLYSFCFALPSSDPHCVLYIHFYIYIWYHCYRLRWPFGWKTADGDVWAENQNLVSFRPEKWFKSRRRTSSSSKQQQATEGQTEKRWG